MQSLNRRSFLRQIAGTTLLTSCGMMTGPLSGQSSRRKQPNILFIFSDDHAVQAIGGYPGRMQDFLQKNKVTPNIDTIIREGGLFVNSFCCNSICGPSRAAILTGKHSHINGFKRNGDNFDGSQWTFPKVLQQAGYQTAMIGKWHLKSNPTGFDYWNVLPGQGHYYNPDFITAEGKKRYEGYCTDIITDFSLDWLKNRDTSKPFMLMCQHKAPHRNWMPPQRYFHYLDDVKVPEPATLFDDYSGRTSSAAHHEMGIDKHMTLTNDLKATIDFMADEKELPWPFKRLNEQQKKAWEAAYGPKNKAFKEAKLEGKDLVRWKYQRYMKDYLRCIKAVDDGVGRLLSYLKENDLEKDTIVIYCSDQGFYLGEHGWFDKRWMYEESLKMPFLIRWPGVVKAGTAYDQLIQNIDYAPTFLDIAGREAPAAVQGRSILPLLKNPNADWRDSIYYHYYEYPAVHMVRKHRGVRTDRFKLMHFYEVDEWEFYDLKKDAREMNSVYHDPSYAPIVKKLKAELARLEIKYKVKQVY